MDRPRHRRKAPQRTGPIRNAREALREGEPWRDSAPRRGDAASSGVSEGYRVIDEQIRRGRQMAQELDDDPRSGNRYDPRQRRRSRYREEPRSGYGEEPWPRYGDGGGGIFGMPLRHMERLVREILLQIVSARPNPWRLGELILRLQIEMFSELARLGFSTLGMAAPSWGDSFEEDAERVERDIDETLDEIEEEEEIWEEEDEPWDWPPAPSTPTTIRSTVPIPVYISSHERTEIDLDLPAGSQSLELEVEPLLISGTEPGVPAPAFEAEFVALEDGLAILRIEVPRDLPAGRYLRRILIRATDEPVGELTVQVGTIPPAAAPKAAPKTSPKGRKKR